MNGGKRLRILQATVILFLLFSSLSGCSSGGNDLKSLSRNKVSEPSSLSNEPIDTADVEGYIIDKTEDSLTIVWNVQQKDITTKTKKEILTIAKPNALTVSYLNASNFNIYDKIAIWTTGRYEESYPSQGVATKVILLQSK